jgi:hypothetical protein
MRLQRCQACAVHSPLREDMSLHLREHGQRALACVQQTAAEPQRSPSGRMMRMRFSSREEQSESDLHWPTCDGRSGGELEAANAARVATSALQYGRGRDGQTCREGTRVGTMLTAGAGGIEQGHRVPHGFKLSFLRPRHRHRGEQRSGGMRRLCSAAEVQSAGFSCERESGKVEGDRREGTLSRCRASCNLQLTSARHASSLQRPPPPSPTTLACCMRRVDLRKTLENRGVACLSPPSSFAAERRGPQPRSASFV